MARTASIDSIGLQIRGIGTKPSYRECSGLLDYQLRPQLAYGIGWKRFV